MQQTSNLHFAASSRLTVIKFFSRSNKITGLLTTAAYTQLYYLLSAIEIFSNKEYNLKTYFKH